MNTHFFDIVKSNAGFAGSYIFLKDSSKKVELHSITNNNDFLTSDGIVKFSDIEALILEPPEFTGIKEVLWIMA